MNNYIISNGVLQGWEQESDKKHVFLSYIINSLFCYKCFGIIFYAYPL